MIDVNEYFNGTVKSLGYNSAEGKSTIGVSNQANMSLELLREGKFFSNGRIRICH